jgi:hypothetical protein
MKHCSHCDTTKELTSFNKRSRSKDGVQSMCRQCEQDFRDSRKENKRTYDIKRYAENTQFYIQKANKRLRDIALASYVIDTAYVTDLYLNAKEAKEIFGYSFHVDHIVPLKHPKVCGLHCEDNLQILSASENLTKSNKFHI